MMEPNQATLARSGEGDDDNDNDNDDDYLPGSHGHARIARGPLCLRWRLMNFALRIPPFLIVATCRLECGLTTCLTLWSREKQISTIFHLAKVQ